MKPGDTFTFAGIYEKVPNPKWRWWKPWLPRKVAGGRLKVFTVRPYNAERHSSMHSGA